MRRRFTPFVDPLWVCDQNIDEDQLFLPMNEGISELKVPMLIEGLLPRSYLVMLAAGPKEGKTCLATAMALAVATGTKFAGLNVNQAPVLWMAQEESHYERLQILASSPLNDPAVPLYTCYEYLPIDRDETLEILANQIERTGAKLIVVDPLYASCSGRNLEIGSNARRTLTKLKRFCNYHNVTALVLHHAKDIHHMSRNPRVADSDQLAATSGLNIVLRHEPIRDGRVVHLYCTGRGDFANKTVSLTSKGPLQYRMVKSPVLDRPIKLGFEEEQVLKIMGSRPRTAGYIGDRLGVSDERLRSLISGLRSKQKIRLVRSAKRPRRYVAVV